MNPCSHFGESCPKQGSCPCTTCLCKSPGGTCAEAKMRNNPLARFIKGPFKADFMGGIVWSADQFHFADVRGWGQLGYKDDGEKIQDFHLQFMVDALNEKLAREVAETAPINADHLEELKREIAWLRFYKKEVYACLGPADDEINRDIRRAYVKKTGLDLLPKQLRIEHEEYEAEHRKE